MGECFPPVRVLQLEEEGVWCPYFRKAFLFRTSIQSRHAEEETPVVKQLQKEKDEHHFLMEHLRS